MNDLINMLLLCLLPLSTNKGATHNKYIFH